ncbi:MAG: hypothetical protein AAGF15_07370 [Pseudomonadota bacterium]
MTVSLEEELAEEAIAHGRLIVILATDANTEPRFQTGWRFDSPQIFGVPVEDLSPAGTVSVDSSALGFPVHSISAVPPGDYIVQAVLHKYETFTLGNGKTVHLPMNRGAGQNWRRAPGNLISEPKKLRIDPAKDDAIEIVLSKEIAPIEPPKDTEYVKHIRVKNERLSAFWGRDIYLGAHVLLPHGFENHPDARYPIAVFHGHFPYDFGGGRTTPPDPDLECVYSKRFDVPCYNRVQQQAAYDFYKRWIADDFPRLLIVQIQHANPPIMTIAMR